MTYKNLVTILLLVLITPFAISYSPDLAIRKELFKSNPISTFSELYEVCCSNSDDWLMYAVNISDKRVVVVRLERSTFGNWNVVDFPKN